MAIRLLSHDAIGKIAAGEVVERPASVVKELLENALDADATRISVRITGGGSELIEVVDDGTGMTAHDLGLAVQRHATSKLTVFDDLDRLITLGFRGEALPSIAAVSSCMIRTRSRESNSGASLHIDFGEVGEVVPTAAAVGTAVAVRDLFANVPARRKFLRQVSTESSYAARTVTAYAVANPTRQVSLTVDGRRVFVTDGAGDDLGAASGALGPDVGQAALRLDALELSATVPGVDVGGWVGAPSLTRSHRQGMIFFVNGRWIQNRALGFALEDAYHSLVMVGRHPVALVHIKVEPTMVDVNVHPTKAEVKFADERAVCRAVQRAAHAALARQPQDVLPRLRFGPVPWPAADRRSATTPQFPIIAPPRADTADPVSAGPVSPVPADSLGVPILRVLGQVGGTFIIAEGPQGMYLIDQHAAHERVLYERILAQLQAKMVDRQPLLDPLIVELAPEEQAVLERSAAELREVGFELESFGDGSIAVRAVPAFMRNVGIAERLRMILDELADGGTGDSWLDSVAISTACHTSIRAGQALSLPEMRELVADLERSSQPRACGHGRPTMLHLTQSDLERQFGRR